MNDEPHSPTTAETLPWSPIETAPRDFVCDYPNNDPRLPYRRMRMSRPLMIRGTHDGETEQFYAVWSVLDDGEGYWFETEPVDWPITEWREATEEEVSDNDW